VSARSERASRVIAPFGGRDGFVRLDRNEDPVGWDAGLVAELSSLITPEALAAYPDATQLTARLAKWTDRSEQEILVTSGSSEGLRLAFETFADEQSTVIRLDPTYSLYELYESIAGSKTLLAHYPPNLVPSTDALLSAIGSTEAPLVVIANPDQPLGAALSLPELRRIANAVANVCGFLVVDEAYHLFGAETALPLIDDFDNVAITRTFSKAFGLAGVRLGYVLGQREIILNLRRLEPAVPPSAISMLAGIWALDHIDVVVERAAGVIAGREYLAGKLQSVAMSALPSLGNFLLVPAASNEQATAIVSGCRKEGFLIKGPLQVGPLSACVRITVGPERLMEEFWSRCGHLFVDRSPSP